MFSFIKLAYGLKRLSLRQKSVRSLQLIVYTMEGSHVCCIPEIPCCGKRLLYRDHVIAGILFEVFWYGPAMSNGNHITTIVKNVGVIVKETEQECRDRVAIVLAEIS